MSFLRDWLSSLGNGLVLARGFVIKWVNSLVHPSLRMFACPSAFMYMEQHKTLIRSHTDVDRQLPKL